MLSTIIMIAVGVVLVGWPSLFIDFACYIIGALLVATGVIFILIDLRHATRNVFVIALGLVIAALGIVIISNPQFVSSVIPLAVGLILLADGVGSIINANGLRRCAHSGWKTLLLLGFITMVFGILIIVHPYGTAQLAFRIMGVALIYNGLSDMLMIFWVGGARKQYEREQDKKHAIDVDFREVD